MFYYRTDIVDEFLTSFQDETPPARIPGTTWNTEITYL